MPSISFYADEIDLPLIRQWLNDDSEIGFIVCNGTAAWKAVKEIDQLTQGVHCMWHIPAGPLPLMPVDIRATPSPIADPWSGWTELRASHDGASPWFGPGHVAIIWAHIAPRGREVIGAIGLSSFEWIGDYYKLFGSAARPETHSWWRRMKGRMAKIGRKVPRNGRFDGEGTSGFNAFAFPSAFEKIRNGVHRDLNPSVF